MYLYLDVIYLNFDNQKEKNKDIVHYGFVKKNSMSFMHHQFHIIVYLSNLDITILYSPVVRVLSIHFV